MSGIFAFQRYEFIPLRNGDILDGGTPSTDYSVANTFNGGGPDTDHSETLIYNFGEET